MRRAALVYLSLACTAAEAMPHERILCSIMAALDYQVPANIVLAVAELENGQPGRSSKNTDGTLDFGPLQFNTVYLAELHGKYGITRQDVLATGCYPYQLAAWRLHRHIAHDPVGDIWTRAANYHSRTPRVNAVYRAKLMHSADKWANWLDARFKTRDVLNSNH